MVCLSRHRPIKTIPFLVNYYSFLKNFPFLHLSLIQNKRELIRSLLSSVIIVIPPPKRLFPVPVQVDYQTNSLSEYFSTALLKKKKFFFLLFGSIPVKRFWEEIHPIVLGDNNNDNNKNNRTMARNRRVQGSPFKTISFVLLVLAVAWHGNALDDRKCMSRTHPFFSFFNFLS